MASASSSSPSRSATRSIRCNSPSPRARSIEVGSNGTLSAGEVQDALPDGTEKTDGQIMATVTARYVEAGADRESKRRYAIRYRWEGGGLFDGKSLRIVDFRRA